MRYVLFLLLLLTVTKHDVDAQKFSTEGRDFWVSFHGNYDLRKADLIFSSETATKVKVHIYGNDQTYEYQLTPNSAKRASYLIADSVFIGSAFFSSYADQIYRKGIHVTSDQDISLFAITHSSYDASATMVLPTHALGKNYTVSTYKDSVYSIIHSGTVVMVVATKDSSRVEITPSQPIDNVRKNGLYYPLDSIGTFNITLNKGEVFKLSSKLDLTGSTINSIDECKPIAVFSTSIRDIVRGGQNCSIYLPISGWDNKFSFHPDGLDEDGLFTQMLPQKSLGKSYLVIPFNQRKGFVLQTVAIEDNTKLEIDGKQYQLKKGEYIRTRHNKTVNIEADKPIQAVQMAQAISCENPPGTIGYPDVLGDSFMLTLNPNDQLSKYATFSTVGSDYFLFHLTILVKTGEEDLFHLSGFSKQDIEFKVVEGKPEFSYAHVTLKKDSTYTYTSEGSGASVYYYAAGVRAAYGYLVSSGNRNLLANIELSSRQLGDIEDEACANDEITFEAVFDSYDNEPRFTDFVWFFGDGTEGEGRITQHTYTEAGEYQIMLIASKGDGDCRTEEIFYKNIEILPLGFDGIIGPESVCPTVTGVEYYIEGNEGNNYDWQIEGGEIVQVSQNQQRITVNWFDTNNSAKVRVTESNILGCTESKELNVVINERLEPPAPQKVEGLAEFLCPGELEGVQYFTPPTPGSIYEWFVQGGDIVSSSGSNVVVNWNASAVKKLWFTEENPSLLRCKGVSDTLFVQVLEELSLAPAITNISCHGEVDGSIALNITGGLAPYSIQWADGPKGTSRSRLARGQYLATVTDAAGCSVSESFTILEPDVLSAEIFIEPTLCYNEKNGFARLQVSGGTAPYRASWNGGPLRNELSNASLGHGAHSVRVLDTNDCELIINFEVNQPEPLFAVTTDSPACPGGSNGTILVEASGGTRPYTYRWNTSPPQDAQLIKNLPAGKYSVTVTDANGCTFTFNDEEIFEKPAMVKLPNVFSPNGDGANDTFHVVYDCQIEFHMAIFSQWGEVVFRTADITQGWDGTFLGEDAPIGKYSYIVTYSSAANGRPIQETQRGSFKLIR